MVNKRYLLALGVSFLLVTQWQSAHASYYNEEFYSYCVYNWIDECPDELDPFGKGGDEIEEEVLDQVSADADFDDQQELAIDADRDPANGFESFQDPDSSSQVFAEIDGDGDGKTDFLLYSVADNAVTSYWDPDSGVIGSVTTSDIDNDNELEYLFDSDGDGEIDAYYDATEQRVYRIAVNVVRFDVDEDLSNEAARNQDLDDRNGFEEYVDEDFSSELYASIDGDRDGRTDLLVSTTATEIPEVYWDPDSGFVAAIIVANTDDDETLEFVFDSDNDGQADKYYDPDTQTVLDFVVQNDRQYTPDGFGGPLYQGLGNFLRSLPYSVVRFLPLGTVWLLLMAAAVFYLSGKQEYKRSKSLQWFADKEHDLEGSKKSFLGLTSHFLRTPLTVVSGYAEMLPVPATGDPSAVNEIRSLVKQIQASVEGLLQRIQADTQIIQPQPVEPRWASYLITALPFGLMSLFVVIVQFGLADFRVIAISVWWLVTLILISLLVIGGAFIYLRRLQTNRLLRKEKQRVLEEQQALMDSRESFFTSAVSQITNTLQTLLSQIGAVKDSTVQEKITPALNDFKHAIDTFDFAQKLRFFTASKHTAIISLADIIQEQVGANQEQITTKQLVINFDPIQFPSINSDRAYVSYLIGTIIDNAVEYSPENGEVDIIGNYSDQDKTVTISMTDDGPGISDHARQLLFQPFSRAEGMEDFTHQGIGLSLYLDQLICQYLEGTIDLESSSQRGLRVVLTLPIT
jgi:signal transduction histidine kinase